MSTKLTLSLDGQIIDEAKKFARSKEKSLSRLIQDLLAQTMEEEKKIRLQKLNTLSGTFTIENPESSLDKLRQDVLKDKYDY